ncbi:MAG: hypothetical protein ABR555_10870 [Pyrinomonadaceae bacterium]
MKINRLPRQLYLLRRIALLPLSISLPFVILVAASLVKAQSAASSTDGWVVLPIGEYNDLRRAAFPSDAEPKPLPVEATLTRVEYDLKVDGDLASGEAKLTVDVIKDGWVRIPMPDGLMVREAKLDGRSVTLARRGNEKNGFDLLLSRTGRAVLSLKIDAPVTTVAGTNILQLPVSNSAISHAVVELARQGVDVHITGGLLLEHSESSTGSRWVANGRGLEPLTFGWRRRIDDARASQPLRMRGAVTELVGLGEDATQVSAEVQIQVLQGLVQEVRVKLPEQFNVNQVAGALVADWDATNTEVKVSLIEPVETTTRFTINGELRLPRSGKVDIPLIRIPAAERETGGVGLEVVGAGEIKDRLLNGLDEAEAAELGQLISSRQSPSLIAFRLQPAEGTSARSLTVDVARYTPQAVLTANVEEAEYTALITADGKLLVRSRFAVRNNQRNFLKINLPPTAVLWSASVAGRPIRPGRAPDGSVLLPLEKTRTGDDAPAFVVEVAYLDRTASWTDKGRLRLTLLALDLPISKSRLLLHQPPPYRLSLPAGLPTSFRLATYSPPDTDVLQVNANTRSDATTAAIQPDSKTSDTKDLVSQLRDNKRTTTPARNLPLRVAFPHFGPSIFLMSELTSESQVPVVDLDFQRDRKRGER